MATASNRRLTSKELRLASDLAFDRFRRAAWAWHDAVEAEELKAQSHYDPNQPRDPLGKWTSGGASSAGGDVVRHYQTEDGTDHIAIDHADGVTDLPDEIVVRPSKTAPAQSVHVYYRPVGKNGVKGKPLTPDQQASNRAFADLMWLNPNVQAVARLISKTEGTTTHGYNTMYGNKDFAKDLSQFPGDASKYGASASGMFQIKKSTYEWQGKDNLGATDFMPLTQRRIFVMELYRTKALQPIIDGNARQAIIRAAKSWASLPVGDTAGVGAYPGQRAKTMSYCEEQLTNDGFK